MMIRRTVLFSGRVQGVGFRHTTCILARGYEVTGYVKNLADGRVEAVIEGDSQEVDRFTGTLRREMADFITNMEVRDGPAAGQFDQFEVRF